MLGAGPPGVSQVIPLHHEAGAQPPVPSCLIMILIVWPSCPPEMAKIRFPPIVRTQPSFVAALNVTVAPSVAVANVVQCMGMSTPVSDPPVIATAPAACLDIVDRPAIVVSAVLTA